PGSLKGRKADGGADGALAQQIQQMWKKCVVAPVTCLRARVAVFDGVLNRTDRKRMRRLYRWFKQRRFERKNRFAVGTPAFRKQNHERALVQDGLDFIVHPADL